MSQVASLAGCKDLRISHSLYNSGMSSSRLSYKPVTLSPQTQASAAVLTSASTLSTPRVSTDSYRPGKVAKTSGIIVKKKSGSLLIGAEAEKPLFSGMRSHGSREKSKLLTVVLSSEPVFPLPTPPLSQRSSHRSSATTDKQRIADLEGKLTRLSQRYKRLESCYRELLVKSVERDRVTPDLDHTRDSAQVTPRQYVEEPMVQVIHILNELRGKVDRVESLSSSMWSCLSPHQGSATDRY